MAQVESSVVALRIIGDDLDPAEITRLLGCQPSKAEAKGERIIYKNMTNNTETVRIARTGGWRLCAVDRTPEDLDGQIAELLSRLTDDLDVWKSLASKYHLDLFCGLFMQEGNEGLSISPSSLAAL